MNYNNMFLHALLSSEETKRNPRWWRSGRKRRGGSQRGRERREVGEGKRRVNEMEEQAETTADCKQT